jgi:nicotinate phosphoribosyltransferase
MAAGMAPISNKIDMLKGVDLHFSEFGTRRRHSFDMQKAVLEMLKQQVPECLNGTSNMHLSRILNLKPIGTMAHEYLCAHQALVRVQDSQRVALKVWAEDFDGDLGIALTDTINMDAFLRDFTKLYAKLFDGCRHDSGDPYIWCDKLIAHYKKLGIDPMTKMAVFSDGLNIPKAIQIARRYKGRINVSFGIGTDLTNDIPGLKPINIVIKMVSCNGQPVAKISDNPGKNICDSSVYIAYLKAAFEVYE